MILDHSQKLLYKAVSICKKCLSPKPPRTHHCSVCNRCILKMDHHCRKPIPYHFHNILEHILNYAYAVCPVNYSCKSYLIQHTIIRF